MLVKEVQASKAGCWNTSIIIESPENFNTYEVTAECVDNNGKTMNVSGSVTYRVGEPSIYKFTMGYNEHNVDKAVDLLADVSTPPIIYFMPGKEFKFELKFTNSEAIKDLYVTSTRNNITKYIEAIYNEDTDTFIANGFFDESNYNYVPGIISYEYNRNTPDIKVSESFDWTPFIDVLPNGVVENIEIKENTDTDYRTTIDLGEFIDELEGVTVDTLISIYDEKTHGDLGTWMGIIEGSTKILSYITYSEDGKEIKVDIDTSDPKTWIAIVRDISGDKVIKYTLDMGMKYTTDIDKYKSLANVSNVLSGVNKVASYAYKYYSIEKDMDKLRDEVYKGTYASETEFNKALERVDNLESDQKMFVLMMLMLPMIVAGAAVSSGPAIVFTAILGCYSAAAALAWQLRKGQIKGEKYKPRPIVDPSGYVYDIASKERLEGVTTTAYCILYDESEDFWENKPADDVYATIWDASEYNQMNPLKTNIDGKYAWDVPECWWRVKYEKEGYETTWSEWLPVPPPQLEVNIGMTTTETPEVKDVVIVGNTATVEFTQYVDVSTVNATNIIIKDGNSTVNGTWSAVDAEEYVKDTSKLIARRFVFTANSELEGNYSISIDKVINYAGIAMKSAYNKSEKPDVHEHSYTSTIVPATCTSNGKVVYTCGCNYSYIEVIPATGHSFTDGQSKCNNCDYNKADSCGCNCHKGGISKIIFKIILIFQKIFKKNKQCTCGVYHY